MSAQDEKKPPEGGVVEVDRWSLLRFSDNTVLIQRLNLAGQVVETYRKVPAGRAAVDLVAILQGYEPVRARLPMLAPISAQGY